MIAVELVGLSTLNKSFHQAVEELTGHNPAKILQTSKRPRAEQAYPLAYFKLFLDHEADPSDVRSMLGFLYIQMLCVGPEWDMAEVTGWQHGLRSCQRSFQRQGVTAVIMAGDGEQWKDAVSLAPTGSPSVTEWGSQCYHQLARYNMGNLFGRMTLRGNTYSLELD